MSSRPVITSKKTNTTANTFAATASRFNFLMVSSVRDFELAKGQSFVAAFVSIVEPRVNFNAHILIIAKNHTISLSRTPPVISAMIMPSVTITDAAKASRCFCPPGKYNTNCTAVAIQDVT